MSDRRSDKSVGFCQTREELERACHYFNQTGLSKATVATRIGVGKSTVVRILNGNVAPEEIEPQRASAELRALANDLWTCRVSSF